MGLEAEKQGNSGKVRVCGRRAVAAFLQTVAPLMSADFGSHAMANLRAVRDMESLPNEIREAAERLLGGTRSIVAGEQYSERPLHDAAVIIEYFVNSVT